MTDSVLNDSLCRVSWRSRPGGFVGLMTLYESNYIRLRQLLGEPRDLPDKAVSSPKDDCPLYLRVDERSRYTTTFTLTYRFDEPGGAVFDPDLQVRVYHDARLGESLQCARWHRHPVLGRLHVALRDNEAARAMDERWSRNMMLNKWLDYCAERGHLFGQAVASHRQR